jgi:hypothetical protein
MFQQRTTGPYTHTIRVTTDGNPDEIVAAIEQLNRPDVTTDVKETAWYNGRRGLFRTTVVMTISLAFLLGFYHAIYCAVRALLGKFQRDETLMDPV